MADGLRDQVGDPLAFNPARKATERSLQTYGVRNPGQSGGDAATKQGTRMLSMIDGIQATVSRMAEKASDNATVEGKIAFAAGMQEQDVLARGDASFTKGWQTTKVAADANNFMLQEAQFLEGEGKSLSPEDYQKYLKAQSRKLIDTLPSDPDVRRAWQAQFSDYAPRLAAAHVERHNEYNENQYQNSLEEYLGSGARINPDATRPILSGQFRVSDSVVADPVDADDNDVDVLVRTMLGEAGGEGLEGMAAVAHVIVNRTRDGRYASSVKDVATQPKQFSTWNSTENGGNNPLRFSQNSVAYQRARVVAEAVLNGRHVDPTGGATHFYAPKGMKNGEAPYWWNQEVARSGGAVKLGGHIFAGKTNATNVQRENLPGTLEFAHADQTGLDGQFTEILSSVAGAVGGKLKITSGHRSEDHPVEAAKIAAGGSGGEHTEGTAADIDMTGMDDNQRAQLVRELSARGVKRFGTYGKSSNMLHVDMKDQQGDGSRWFMNNKSAANMDSAPEWFKAVSGEDLGSGAGAADGLGMEVANSIQTGIPNDETAVARSTRIQQTLRAAPGKASTKVAALSNSMIRALRSGDDTLFNDAGGIATLHGFGATPEQINAVIKAKEHFDDAQDKKFDASDEKWRSQVLADVTAGKFASFGDVADLIEERVQAGLITDQEARSLARAVDADMKQAAASEDSIIPVRLRSEAAKLYDAIQSDLLSPEEASERTIQLGTELGVKASVINNFVASMFTKKEQRDAELRSQAKTLYDKYEKDQALIGRVQQALSRDVGLKGLSGTITAEDPETGKVTEIPAVQYGINLLKDSVTKEYMASLASVRENEGEQAYEDAKNAAPASITAAIYEKLAKQQVPDTKFGQQIISAVTGNIVNPDKSLNEDAVAALDWYMQMRSNPNVGTAYIASMVPDNDARTLLETAAQMYDGRGNISTSLLKAHHMLTTELTPRQDMDALSGMRGKISSEVKGIVSSLTDDRSFLGAVLNSKSAYSESDINSLSQNTEKLADAIEIQAQTYQLNNRREPVKVSIQKAKDDVARNSVVIGGQVVMGNSERGQRIDQVMFGATSGYTKVDAQQAVTQYLDRYGPSKWKSFWTERTRRGISYPESRDNLRATGAGNATVQPPYEFQYDPGTGTAIISLYKDESRTETVGEPMVLDMRSVGMEYKKTNTKGDAPVGADFYRSLKENMIRSLTHNTESPGRAIGGMAGQ
jgi:spore germination cell wall hydrolase CwlJ-like protein